MIQLKEILDAYRNNQREFPSYGELMALAEGLKDIRNQTLEEAAAICEDISTDKGSGNYKGRMSEAMNPQRCEKYASGQIDGATDCANAIRALAELAKGT